jgi:cation transport ATPase
VPGIIRVVKAARRRKALTGEILDKFSQLITTVLGLVAALAWNDVIQTLFQQFLGSAGGALAAKIFYAVLVTIIVTSVPKHKHTHFAV